ncbi:MAG TPA: sensor histidine kinase [Ktedonobacterales bacterium]|nr:sensor histidine kinase [Ktedonobacterales bacterium]
MSSNVRGLLSLVTLALIALYGWTLRPGPLAWGALVALGLMYLCAVWARENWWTGATYAVFTGLAIALAGAISLASGSAYASALLIPPIMLLAREQRRELRAVALLLAVMTMAAMLGLTRFSPLAFSLLPGALTLYVSIRAINIYKEAHRVSQRHLEALDAAHEELRQAHAELQEASALSMRYAALTERARMAREMHDGLGHQLTSLIVQLQALQVMLANEPERAAGEIQAILRVAREAMAEIRHAVGEWREDESGLGLVALQGLVSQTAARSRLALEFQTHGVISEWPVATSVALYRILQEALTNIMRHADATSAAVTLEERDRRVILAVADDGGYTADSGLTPGFGVRGIMERCEALGGSYTLSQAFPHGLFLRVTLPLDATGASGAPQERALPAAGRAAAVSHP